MSGRTVREMLLLACTCVGVSSPTLTVFSTSHVYTPCSSLRTSFRVNVNVKYAASCLWSGGSLSCLDTFALKYSKNSYYY